MNIFFYVAPIIIWLAICANGRITNYRLLLGVGLLAKLMFAYLMTYLLITQYEFGDLHLYYAFARDLSLEKNIDEVNLLWGAHIVAVLNSFIFMVFPPSIYGLATITGISSFLYSYDLIRSFDNYLKKSYLFFAAALLLFLPVLGTQSGYIGKETYVLPFLGFIFYSYRFKQRITPRIAFSIIAIGLIRPYQAFVLVAAFVPTIILFARGTSKIKTLFITLLLLIAVLLFFGSWLSYNISIILDIGMEKFMAETYSSGNLTLDPFPQPFTILQNFRPFIWESHNLMSMVASVENMIPLAFGFIFALRYIRYRNFRLQLHSNPFLVFTSIYVTLNLLIFMYNSNIGDLARRHIYYYPQIILLGYFALSLAKPLKHTIAHNFRSPVRMR
jgi:hypothetical protein